MKLNDTTPNIGGMFRCCSETFANHFYPEVPEVEDAPEAEDPNPDVEPGESFECPHCKYIILLEGTVWTSLPPSEVVDLSAPVVAEEPLTTA